MQEVLVQRWGSQATPKFQSWRRLVVEAQGVPEMERVTRINEFFNRLIAFGEDAVIWGQADYWATPMETIGRGEGDCEDYAIAKFFTLRMVGVPAEKLRLAYVQARTNTGESMYISAHMVLAYYAEFDAKPLVLDNLIRDIRPASQRPDLAPVFSFNSEGVFKGAKGQGDARIGGTARLSRWEDLLRRVREEGFE